MLLRIALAVVVILLLTKLFRRRGRKVAAPERTEIDRWVDQQLARELAHKLALPPDAVRRAFNGDPEPEVVTAVESAVRAVEICYGKQPDGAIEVRLEIRFEDGETSTATRRVASSEVPEGILDEYRRTGSARIYRPHPFTWSR